MRYLGGKVHIAKRLTTAINREVGATRPCWEPFMGGGGMTEHLARTRTGTASDSHPALMAMWQALQTGWQPPKVLSEAQYRCARQLPDTDPLKAFVGFGCSFAGKCFAGYAADLGFHIDVRWVFGARHYFKTRSPRSYVAEAQATVCQTARLTRHWSFECVSFFDREPGPTEAFIYADPPYASTTGYSTGAFPHELFWRRCQQWARYAPVLVSEYACPVPHRVLFERRQSRTCLTRGHADAPTERLFRITPPGPRPRLRHLST